MEGMFLISIAVPENVPSFSVHSFIRACCHSLTFKFLFFHTFTCFSHQVLILGHSVAGTVLGA